MTKHKHIRLAFLTGSLFNTISALTLLSSSIASNQINTELYVPIKNQIHFLFFRKSQFHDLHCGRLAIRSPTNNSPSVWDIRLSPADTLRKQKEAEGSCCTDVRNTTVHMTIRVVQLSCFLKLTLG